LGEYEAISITLIRSDRHKTTVPVVPTSAFGVVWELEGQLFRICGRGILVDMGQQEDNRTPWTVCTAAPFLIILQSTKLSPVPDGSTFAVWINRELSVPLKALPNQLTKKMGVNNILTLRNL
jgi:hypothetical protein